MNGGEVSAGSGTKPLPYILWGWLITVSFRLHKTVARWDWRAEITQATIIDAPNTAVSASSAQGQLCRCELLRCEWQQFLSRGGLSQAGIVRYGLLTKTRIFASDALSFLKGRRRSQSNLTLAWPQPNRVAQRLVGNFGFTNAQRNFDGIDAHYGQGTWDVTAMAARSDQRALHERQSGIERGHAVPCLHSLMAGAQFSVACVCDWLSSWLAATRRRPITAPAVCQTIKTFGLALMGETF